MRKGTKHCRTPLLAFSILPLHQLLCHTGLTRTTEPHLIVGIHLLSRQHPTETVPSPHARDVSLVRGEGKRHERLKLVFKEIINHYIC